MGDVGGIDQQEMGIPVLGMCSTIIGPIIDDDGMMGCNQEKWMRIIHMVCSKNWGVAIAQQL